MNKLKENTTIKSITLINKENFDKKKNKINDNLNINTEQTKSNNFKIQQIKNNENIANKKPKKKEEQKYFEFHAHFKYNELVDALNKLKSTKNESTSNTSNANININSNNNIRDKNDTNYNDQRIILNNIDNTQKNNRPLNKSKPRNHKGVSRNIQMNNYIKYLGYIEECKDNNNNLALSSISNNIQQNKTSYLPKTEIIKKRINEHLEQLNQLKHKILLGKNTADVKKEEKCDKIIKDNKIDSNQKNQNLISISLIGNGNNKNIVTNCSNYTKNINSNNNQLNKKIIKNQIKNINKKQINNFNNKAKNKINKEESINNSKIQLKANNLFLNNININSNGNKFIKNKKIKNNVPNFNCDLVGEKRKAHSSSISKNKKSNVHKINTNNIIINNLNNVNNFQVPSGTNKKQNTLNNILTSNNRIKPVTTKSFQTNKISIGIDNKNSKMKIITLNYVDIGKIKNKIIKKSINSFGSSLCKTKDIDKTKSKSNSKSNSKNKTSNGKLLTDKNEKNDKNKLYKYNNRINAIQKEKTYVNQNAKKINDNLKVDTNKSLSKNNLSRFNKTQNKEINIIDNQSNLNNKKKGINLVFNGQFESKNGNVRINSIIYNMNKNNNKNTNINNSIYNLDKNNQLKQNINISNKKNNLIKNNIIINNQKSNNSKNNKNKINSIVTIFNNGNNNINISSKKNEGFKKTKKIII
jgi:hypothetical protein